jgi:2-methylisocitrate lyase-like PEP mutase family enzyme
MTTTDVLRPGEKLRKVLGPVDGLGRRTAVPSVLGMASALQAMIAQLCGCQIGFVGTALTVRNYLALPDTGVASATECLQIAGHIARSVEFPVILDGDTGHGGSAAVRRLVREAIREGLAGLRLDDQPLEGKLPTQTAGIEVVDQDDAITRYRAAVEARDEIDPSFVIMAQCFGRDAVNGGLDDAVQRVHRYDAEAGVDWVQMEGAQSVEEIRTAAAGVTCWFSAMTVGKPLSQQECLDLGLSAGWYTIVPPLVLQATAYEFLQEFAARGIDAWTEYRAAHADTFAALSVLGR